MGRTGGRLSGVLVGILATGCTSLSGLTGGTADAGADARTDAPTDARADGKADASGGDGGSDAATAGCVADPSGYDPITSEACWDAVDTTTVGGPVGGCAGGTFDGRYVVLAQGTSSNTGSARYDTQGTFSSAASWSFFDVGTLKNGALTSGVTTDGKRIFSGNDQGMFALAYDPSAGPFSAASSWSTFAYASLPAFGPDAGVGAAPGMASGAVFDGQYVYFVQTQVAATTEPPSGVVPRYDTTKAFTDPSAWGTFDTTTVSATASGYSDGVFDGRYLYLLPSLSNVMVRYDTTLPFTSASAWTPFDVGVAAQVTGTAANFQGGVFDGRYLYLVPADSNQAAVRYDTTAPFTQSASWTRFLPASFVGLTGTKVTFGVGAFDGRFVYFGTGYAFDLGVPVRVIRYDTAAPLDAAAAWSSFDAAPLGIDYFATAVFDGQYLYLGSGGGPVIARFKARATPQLPALPDFHGSFY